MLKSLLVSHVMMCQRIAKAWFQCAFVVSGVRFGRFSRFFRHILVLDGVQWLGRRGQGISLSLRHVLEQLQNDSDSGCEEFDLEEKNEKAKKND